MRIRERISRCAEELCPFPFCYWHTRSLKKQRDASDILSRELYKDYPSLSEDSLTKRLEEEHQGSVMLDEKTSKLTLSLSVAFTALGLVVAFFRTSVPSEFWQGVLLTLIGLSVFYTLGAGFVALGAFRTMCRYGYGTQFLLNQQDDIQAVLARNLARQEIMNTVRHVRNETAFQALRNGLVLLTVCVGLLLGALAWASFSHVSTSESPQVFANALRQVDKLDAFSGPPNISFDKPVPRTASSVAV